QLPPTPGRGSFPSRQRVYERRLVSEPGKDARAATRRRARGPFRAPALRGLSSKSARSPDCSPPGHLPFPGWRVDCGTGGHCDGAGRIPRRLLRLAGAARRGLQSRNVSVWRHPPTSFAGTPPTAYQSPHQRSVVAGPSRGGPDLLGGDRVGSLVGGPEWGTVGFLV